MTAAQPSIVVFIADQEGLAARLVAEHADDGTGRCRVCPAGARHGHHCWRCRLHLYARAALVLRG